MRSGRGRVAAVMAVGVLVELMGNAPSVPSLGLLVPVSTAADNAAVLAEVAAAGGAGIILRDLDGPSIPGDAPHELEWQFNGRLDMVGGQSLCPVAIP